MLLRAPPPIADGMTREQALEEAVARVTHAEAGQGHELLQEYVREACCAAMAEQRPLDAAHVLSLCQRACSVQPAGWTAELLVRRSIC